MGTCTFCGHSRIYGDYENAKQRCFAIVEELIYNNSIDCFLIGDYGSFDAIAAAVCLSLKKKYPHIQVCLVLPYYRPHLDEYDKERYAKFDSVITPGLENTPRRFRILKCNEYMADQADTVIAYVKYDGGAAKTLAYAQRRKKQIINIASERE
ncbi:MAG: hypothetical protein Q3982_02395 [Phoenicibacter congonensis]|uniref:DUF1273 domain-containing protein n=1 Tax=Phoenicibacter congonensis TaxID=1944646 RepID=A0AA43RGV8_9ACTN|nr:hypothetical protein [Phoenicibacter congonensis]